MNAAIAARDAAFDGEFVFGVVTTGVVCRPSCPARASRLDNRRFFADLDAAVLAGFRPCKRCRPGAPAPAVQVAADAARFIEQHADQRVTLAELAERAALSPARLQKTFKAAFGVSPRQYHEAVRLGLFKRSLRSARTVTEALYQAGFESTSRAHAASQNMGMTPSAYRSGGRGETIRYACRVTSLGPLLMAATARGVCFAQFGDNTEALVEQLRAEFPAADIAESRASESPELTAWVTALDAHLSSGAPRPDVPLDLRGTAFQVKVWRFLQRIGEGDVMSYSELAAALDQPTATRAVASACAKNRIAVLVPCHRVLRADRSLGGYRWGMERKQALLDRERARRA